jgi:hypothetical protein
MRVTIDLAASDALTLSRHDAAAFRNVALRQFYLLVQTGHRCKPGEV